MVVLGGVGVPYERGTPVVVVAVVAAVGMGEKRYSTGVPRS